MNANNRPIARELGLQLHSAEAYGEGVAFEVLVAGTTKNGDEVFDYQQWVTNVAHVVTDIAGGCQLYEGKGFWCTSTMANCVPERVTNIQAVVSRQALAEGAGRLRQVLPQYKQECEQQAVAVFLDGEMYLL